MKTRMNKDYFEVNYNSEETFLNDLDVLVENQEWLYMPIKKTKIKYLPDVPMLIGTDDLDVAITEKVDREAIEETMKNIKLILKTEDEGDILMRGCAYKSLLERASIGMRTIHRLYDEDTHNFLQFVNLGLNLYGEVTKVLIRKGRVSAMHSKDYAPLKQTVLFNGAIDILKERYDEYKFESGVVTEEYTSCMIELNPSRELYVSLEKLLAKMGATQVFPTIRFTTSDLGKSNARMTPMLKTDKGNIIGFGTNLDVKHIGKNTEKDFLDLVGSIFPLFEETANKIKELENMTICYPTNVFVELCKKQKVQTKIVNIAIEQMNELYGKGAKMFGSDLYFCLCNIMDVATQEGMKGTDLLLLEDTVGRMLLDNWGKYDYPTVTE